MVYYRKQNKTDQQKFINAHTHTHTSWKLYCIYQQSVYQMTFLLRLQDVTAREHSIAQKQKAFERFYKPHVQILYCI